MNSLSRVFPLFQRKSGCIGEESANKMNNLSIEMQDFMHYLFGNSSAMRIHKLPDCTDWLTNIRVFRQLISCRASAL